MSAERDIVLVGTGNVAWHLAHALAGRIKAVAGRSVEHARLLAQECDILQWCPLSEIASLNASIVIISVADNALESVAAAIGSLDSRPLVLHTSGTMPKEALAAVSTRTGVLYPLQTFTRGAALKLEGIPIFIECADEADSSLAEDIARSISGVVHRADPSRRALLHIAGVFSSNFVNALLEMAGDILARAGYPLTVVRPLAEATLEKAFVMTPHKAQTGPALRGDGQVMSRQAEALSPELADIYRLLSEYIIRSHNVDIKYNE